MLEVCIFAPFVFALLIGVCAFIKNPIYIKRIYKGFFFIEFIFSFLALVLTSEKTFTVFNFSFYADKISLFYIFLTSFVFFLASIISKTIIVKMHRLFGAVSLLLMGLVNFVLVLDNIFLLCLIIFWIFMVCYFLSVSFSKKEDRKSINIQLTSDLFWCLAAVFLISKDFIRYFLVNEIEPRLSLLSTNLYHIDDLSIFFAFLGFLILISRFFNFIPFSNKNLSNSTKINPLVFMLETFSSLVLGSFLFTKCYLNFDYLFYQNQDLITIYLLLNFGYYVVLSLRHDNFFKFLSSIITPFSIVGMFSVFSFEDGCFCAFLYFSFVLCVSYCFLAFVFMILKDKFKTDKFEELQKITDKTKISQVFILIPLLNIACAPFLGFFGAMLICFMMIFATDYDGYILNLMPYVLIFGIFLLCLSVYNIIFKILIEPASIPKTPFCLSYHQTVVFSILTFVIIILSLCPFYLFWQFGLHSGGNF